MAEAHSSAAFPDVRASIKRMRSEGERLLNRVRKDASKLASRSGRETVDSLLTDVRRLRTDARKQVESLLKDIDARRTRLQKSIEKQAVQVVDQIGKRLNVARRDELDLVHRRLIDLERRVDELSKRKEEAA
jgi:uncharacterized protein with PIN domain